MKTITGILLSLTLFITAAVLAQAPETQTREEAARPAQTGQAGPAAEGETADATEETDDEGRPDIAETFSPTEEISEDLSVPFPVDI